MPSIHTAALLAINPSEGYATTNFLERDVGGAGLHFYDERVNRPIGTPLPRRW
jgi:hypothetical protein